MRNATRVLIVTVALLVGALVMPRLDVVKALDNTLALRITPNADTANATAFRVDNTSGTAQLSIVSSTGVATFAAVPVFSAGIGATTFNPGVTLGAAAVTGTITSPFTLTGGADVLIPVTHGGNPAAGDTILRVGDNTDASEVEIFGEGALTADGLITGTGGVTSTGTLTANGIVVLGDGGDNFSVASDGIDISTAGAITNATTIAGTGISTTTAPVSLGDGSSTFAVASTGIDVTAAGAISNATTIAATGTISTTNGSVTSADLDGYNAGTGELVSGVPTVRMDVVAGTAGAQDVILDNCEAGSAATWTPGGAVPPTDADTAVTYRVGSGGVSVTFGDVGVGDATETMATGGNWDASADEYIFLWIRSTAALSAGTLTLTLDDDTAAPDATVNLGAVATANQWTLQRIDISAVADADKNVVSDLILTSNHATELDAAVVTFDQFVKVDNAESTALAFNAVNQPGGIRSGFSFVEDAGNGAFTALVENTDFFVDYVNDRVYWMTDQSTLNDILLYASSN